MAHATGDPASEWALRPHDVGRHLHVSADTVTAWSDRGDLPCRRLPSGHRRYRLADVLAFQRRLDATEPPDLAPADRDHLVALLATVPRLSDDQIAALGRFFLTVASERNTAA